MDKTHYPTLIVRIDPISHERLYKFDHRPAIQVVKELEGVTGEVGFTYDVYALVKSTKRKIDQADYNVKEGHYYWTDAEGTRRRIVDMSSEHLRGVLTMPDFKNSRLTPEMRRAITRELGRRDEFRIRA